MNFSPVQIRIFKMPENMQQNGINPQVPCYSQPTNDCFIKTTKAQATNSIKKTVLSAEQQALEKLYNETYEEVLTDISETNPAIKEIILQKPNLNFIDFDSNTQEAAYNFETNEIRLNNSLCQKKYLISVKDKEGNILVSNFVNENQLESETKELKVLEIENYEIRELTKYEQDIYCKSIIAHELRHFVQEHLMAATKTIGEKHDKKAEEKITSIERMKEGYIQACKKEGKTPDENLLRENTTIYNGYKQNKIFPQNTTFKFSSNKNDNRYWSIEEDFWTLTNYYMSLESGDNYFPRPTEIDAFNYELEYFNKHSNKLNLSEDFISEFTKKQKENIEKGLKSLEATGFTFKRQ